MSPRTHHVGSQELILFSHSFSVFVLLCFGELASEHRDWGRVLDNVILTCFVLNKSHPGLYVPLG